MTRKLILLILILLSTVGCNLIDGAEFFPSDYFIGVELCKNNDGLKGVYVKHPGAAQIYIYCNNTAKFSNVVRFPK